jgi:hypothetical protein
MSDLLSKNKYVERIPKTYIAAKCPECNGNSWQSFQDDETEKLVFRCKNCHWTVHSNLRSFRWNVM